MLLSALWMASIQVAPAILLLWAVSRLYPALSPKVQVWLWRLVFLRLTVGLFLWPAVEVPVLPAEPVAYTFGAVAADAAAPVEEPAGFPTTEAVWATGVLVLGLLAVRQSLRLRGIAMTAEPLASVHVADTRPLSGGTLIRVCPRAAYPMVVGPLKPTILLPQRLVEESTDDEIRLVVAHEMGHIAHRDLWWSWLVWTGRTLFFFHPMVWLAARCERMARETAADRYAVEVAGIDAHSYGQVLLRVALGDARPSSLSPTGLAMSDSYRFIYRRLETMKHLSQRPTRGRIVVTCTLCALTIGLLPAFSLVPGTAQEPFTPTMDTPVVPVLDSNSPQQFAGTATSGEIVFQAQVQGHPHLPAPARAPRPRQAGQAVPAAAPRPAVPSLAPSPAPAPTRVTGRRAPAAVAFSRVAPRSQAQAAKAPAISSRRGLALPAVAPAASPSTASIQIDSVRSSAQIAPAILAPVVQDAAPLAVAPAAARPIVVQNSLRTPLRSEVAVTVATAPQATVSVHGQATLLTAVAAIPIQRTIKGVKLPATRTRIQFRGTTLTGHLRGAGPLRTTTQTLLGAPRLKGLPLSTRRPSTLRFTGVRVTTLKPLTTTLTGRLRMNERPATRTLKK